MIETWKDVAGLEDAFQVSNYGRIRSLDRYAKVCGGGKRLVKGRILKPSKSRNGYYEAKFSYKGKRIAYLLHRLVALHFIENPLNLPEVNHKDENIQNNRAENLEWCTSKYNANYGSRNLRMMKNRKFIPVLQFDKSGKLIKKWDKMTDACRETGADISSIIRVCKGKQKSCVGFVWQYADNKKNSTGDSV